MTIRQRCVEPLHVTMRLYGDRHVRVYTDSRRAKSSIIKTSMAKPTDFGVDGVAESGCAESGEQLSRLFSLAMSLREMTARRDRDHDPDHDPSPQRE